MNEVERMFQRDIREKKQTGRGIHNRASRKGLIKGGVKTQSDFMTKKQVKELNGEVKVYKMYETIKEVKDLPSLEELESKSEKIIIDTLKYIQSTFKAKEVAAHWHMCHNSLLDLYAKYKVYVPRVSTKKGIYLSIEDAPSIEDFVELSVSQQKGVLIAMRQQFTVNAIGQHWNMDRSQVYALLRKHNAINSRSTKDVTSTEIPTIEPNEKKTIKNQIKKEPIVENINTNNNDEIIEMLKQLVNKTEQSKQVNNGFNISFNGEYDKDEIESKLLSIAQIISENKKYKVTLELNEVI